MNNNKTLSSIVLLIILYLLSTTNFFIQFISNELVGYLLMLTLRLIFIIFAIFYIKPNGLPQPFFQKLHVSELLLLPLILVAFSNLFVVLITHSPLNEPINGIAIWQGTIFDLFVVFAEELVFRAVLLVYLLKKYKPLVAIIVSSIIFGFVHLVNISSLASIFPVLVQCIYSVGIGLVCGLIYYVSKNFALPLFFHYCFNFFNGNLIPTVYKLPQTPLFYIINGVIALVAIAYGSGLFVYFNKKGENDYATKNMDIRYL